MFNFEKTRENYKPNDIEDILDNGHSKLKLVLFRHGPKKEASGEKDELAESFNIDVEVGLKSLDFSDTDYIHISSSAAPRALNTKAIAEKNFIDKSRSRPVNNQLGTFENLKPELKSDLNILIAYQKKLEEKFKAAQAGKNNQENQVDLKNQIDSVILANLFDGTLDNLGRELKVGGQVQITTADFAHNLEEYTRGFLEHLDLLSATGKPASLNITHSYPIMSFLKNNLKFIEDGKIVVARDLPSQDFLVKTGGCLPEARDVTLNYLQKGNQKIIKVAGPSFSGFIDYEE